MTDPRAYPERPILAASAAIIRDGRVLVVRRARAPALGRYTLPGGVVEAGETVMQAAAREVREETGLLVEPVALAGYRDLIIPGGEGRAERHFVILAFQARLIGGDLALNDELDEARWLTAAELALLPVTEGLGEIVEAAFRHAASA